ncbi:DinB family protein [Jiangella rhizosphaerae]|uniref:DinB family protein n=1 Tax=Jiangella rhizosphaerae TaxID=2293569 RepID=A0A418KU48_9ACTN|nr:DinB family protein [Jiangella rhizosphaerae]RIQ31186.1 DinB family protein [Jiangella rhizosphaerae]
MTDVDAVVPLTRVEPPLRAAEKDALVLRLDFLRETVVNKVAGLSTAQATTAPVPPSTLTPAGIVRHLMCVERWWFALDFAALPDVPEPWGEHDAGGFDLEPGETLASVVRTYLAECARSNEVIAAYSLDDVARGEGMDFDLRYAVVHMIEETGRHCGHLDLLREAIDGAVGE